MILGEYDITRNVFWIPMALLAALLTYVAPLPDSAVFLIGGGTIVSLCIGYFSVKRKRAMSNGMYFGIVLVVAHFFIYEKGVHPNLLMSVLLPMFGFGAMSAIASMILAVAGNKLHNRGDNQ